MKTNLLYLAMATIIFTNGCQKKIQTMNSTKIKIDSSIYTKIKLTHWQKMKLN